MPYQTVCVITLFNIILYNLFGWNEYIPFYTLTTVLVYFLSWKVTTKKLKIYNFLLMVRKESELIERKRKRKILDECLSKVH